MPPAATVLPVAYPLDDFYARASRPLPPIRQIPGEEMPEPYRTLLVHEADMTPTLEQFHGANIHLRVLNRQQRDGAYYREVVLLLDGSNQAVEFGAIRINIDLFPPGARSAVLKEGLPLGHVLAEYKIKHTSRPKGFFAIEADDFINDALGLKTAQTLYGRRNTLYDSQKRPLAEIVEILPPAIPKS